jgi:hypothetical protein
MSNSASKAIMWLIWFSAVAWGLLMAVYIAPHVPKLNSFARPFDIFPAGMFLIPILICGGLRFWLSRIRNPWLALLPYLVGAFFALQAEPFGMYLVPEYCVLFQVLGAALLLAYWPGFIRDGDLQPPAAPAG